MAQFSHAVCQVVHISPWIRSAFNYTNPSPSLVYFFLTIHLFYSTKPLCICIPNPVWCPPQRLRHTYRKKEKHTVQLGESSNFQLYCMNISFFPCSKASKLAWNSQGSHRNFHVSCGKFSGETRGWSRVMHEVCCIYLKTDLFKKISHVKLLLPLCCRIVAWITHKSCKCLTWKVVFSVHLPALCLQRKIRTFPQAVL